MGKIRPEENAVCIWNLQRARTAYISGEELNALERWGQGENNVFADRLKTLGLIEDGERLAVKEAIALSRDKKAPRNSFCAPESLHVELTGYCPLDCPQCYKDKRKSEPLDYDFLLSVIQQAEDIQVFQIALGGGEPLSYPNLHLVLAEINQRGMASSITTSGFGLDSHFLDELIGRGLRHIQISINGSNEKIHSQSRDGYEYAVRALDLLKKTKVSFGVNWVARRDNIDDFPDFIKKMKSYNVDNINILRYKPSANETYEENRLSADKMALLFKIIKNTRSIRLKTDSAFGKLLCHLNQRVSFMSGCGAGRRFLALDADGFYRPCSHVNMKERADNLYQLWYQSKYLDMFRSIGDKIGEPCAQCDYLLGCYGCRAVVLGQGGDFFDGDKECSDSHYNCWR